jgi:flagellar export protein FliJ
MIAKRLTRTIAIKERVRQWRRAELQEAESKVTHAEEFVEAETAQHAGAAALVTREGECSAIDLALYAEQLERAQLALKRAEARLNALQEERETRRDEVGEATREVRAMEALHTRMLVEQRREANLREQRDTDEAASRKRPQ